MNTYLQLVLFKVSLIISLSCCLPCEVSIDKTKADCSNRGYDHIPPLSNLTEDLDISGNVITQLDKTMFLNLTKLKFLNLNWNKIKHIDKDTFSGLKLLRNLSVGHNKINILQEQFGEIRFTFNPKLRVLDLSFNTNSPLNDDAIYPDTVFGSLTYLQELRVDLLPNPIFGPGFTNMTQLNRLVFKDCVLMHIANDTFRNFRNLELLTYLDMSNCQVNNRYFVKIETAFLQYFTSLQYLDLSYTSITFPVAMDILYGLTITTNSSNRVRKMEVLNLYNVNPFILLWMYNVDYTVKVTTEMTRYYRQLCVEDINVGNNGIVEIEVGTLESFDDFSCLKRYSLSENNFIFTFPHFALSVMTFYTKSIHLEELDYSYVAIKFPKEMNDDVKKLPAPQKQSSFRCVMPFKFGQNMRYLRLSHLVFPFYLDCDFDLSSSPELYLLDVSQTTLLNTDFRIRGGRIKYMNVSGMDFATSGRLLLGSLTWVHRLVIQNANLDHAFSNRNYVFKDVKKIEEVDMSWNHLNTLEEESVQGLEGVNNLILSWNFFSDFPDGLYSLRNLTEIDLRHNKLTYLRKKTRTWLELMNSRPERNIKMLMNGNPFACTCDTLDFVFWICDTRVMLDHHNNYSCILPNGSVVMLRHVNDNYQLYLGSCQNESFWLVFAISGISILLLFLVSSAFSFKYRWKIQYYFWRKINKQAPPVNGVMNYMYKAFIVFSEDDWWSRNSFFPKIEELEVEHGVRFCWQERDFSQEMYQLRQLSECLPNCEKLVFVITEEFIMDNWCEFLLNTCIKERVVNRNKCDCLVMIFKDIDFRRVPEYVTGAYKYCSTITYPEEENDIDNFWDELRQKLSLL
ncbi:toll-like receptor 4 [Ylistrum balloti]|uniref:toll-like receptor 4 n=1 Tax=Ylistrum balloti TaxID=509963 RepID=UPI002905CB42|nr:toll-like receptor 4 [Ylistrum balloti]